MDKISGILSFYESENRGVLANLYRVLSHGALGNTGKVVILPVDQGVEHGPDASFLVNSDAYDPYYHYDYAVQSLVSAYAGHVGVLSTCDRSLAGKVPTILKLNCNNSINPNANRYDQAVISSVKDALELGCVGVGVTIYPGSRKANDMIRIAREIIAEARSFGLFSIVWSYPRGEEMQKEEETAIDICSYAAYIACSIGAHIVKVKVPSSHISRYVNANEYRLHGPISNLQVRIAHVVRSAFCGRRIILFSGGSSKTQEELLLEVKSISDGGAYGSMIGRNVFQRSKNDSLELLEKIFAIYRS